MVDILVNSLGLSVRASNALNRMQIHTLEQLLNTPIEEIKEARNIGAKTVDEIETFCKSYLDGAIEIDTLTKKVYVSEITERTFSEDDLEEMSHHNITELELSARAENGLLRIGCDTLSKLAMISEKELREMKGLGAKTCDEILNKREAWTESNLCVVAFDENAEIITESEKAFYEKISDIICPIKHLFWRQLRKLFLENDIMQLEDDFSLYRINDKFILTIIQLDEFDLPLKSYFRNLVPDEFIKMQNLRERIDEENLDFDGNILIERLLDSEICKQKNDYIYLNKPKVVQYLENHKDDFETKKYESFLRRLNGESLQEIGDVFDLTRERVRQILVKMAKKMPYLFEDYYRFPYEHFKFSKEEFRNAFPECGDIGYEYLSIRYKKGKDVVSSKSVENYTGIYKERMYEYLKEEELRQDKRHVTRTEMVYRVLMSNSDRSMTMDEFEKEYNEYLNRRNYPKDRLTINIRTVSNRLRLSPHIVFDKDNRMRYCEADPQIIWNKVDFNQYRDMIISAELIYRDYIELMEELDIRDGYELFYIIKSSLDNWDNKDFDISCRRVPVMVLGDGDEAKQALHLLKEISPIDFLGYYEAYEERYGVRSASGNPVITGALANYYLDGEYSVDVIAIDDGDAEKLKLALSKKNFWFIDEVEKLFKEICTNSSQDALNKAAFKRIGYSLNIGYLYNDEYGTVVNYYDQEIFSKKILDLNEYDRRLLVLSSFESALYKKRMELEYIEVAPKVYMTLNELERIYGLSLEDVHKLQEWILQCEDKYFNAHSVWQQLENIGLDKNLQHNEWLCTCIFRQQPYIFSQQVAGGIILCKDSSELNLGSICKWIVDKCGKMTVQSLTAQLNETFATRIPVSKIAEKLKAYGLWDILVTDSFDEYIDNLIVSTDTDIDVDDLLQEEFF
jgi:hypothetical protein